MNNEGSGSVRFVRIGNRVVPIRSKGSHAPKGEGDFARTVAKSVGISGSAATAYGTAKFVKGITQMTKSIPRAIAAHRSFGFKSKNYETFKAAARSGAKSALIGSKIAKVGAITAAGGFLANSILKRFQRKKDR